LPLELAERKLGAAQVAGQFEIGGLLADLNHNESFLLLIVHYSAPSTVFNDAIKNDRGALGRRRQKEAAQKNNPPLFNQLLDLRDYWAAANAAA
jgi:hypothetical protein